MLSEWLLKKKEDWTEEMQDKMGFWEGPFIAQVLPGAGPLGQDQRGEGTYVGAWQLHLPCSSQLPEPVSSGDPVLHRLFCPSHPSPFCSSSCLGDQPESHAQSR